MIADTSPFIEILDESLPILREVRNKLVAVNCKIDDNGLPIIDSMKPEFAEEYKTLFGIINKIEYLLGKHEDPILFAIKSTEEARQYLIDQYCVVNDNNGQPDYSTVDVGIRELLEQYDKVISDLSLILKDK